MDDHNGREERWVRCGWRQDFIILTISIPLLLSFDKYHYYYWLIEIKIETIFVGTCMIKNMNILNKVCAEKRQREYYVPGNEWTI